MNSTKKSKSSIFLALLSLIVGFSLNFYSFILIMKDLYNNVFNKNSYYDSVPGSGVNFGLIILRLLLLYVGVLLVFTGIFVFKNKSPNLNSETDKNFFTKSFFLQTLVSSKPLYYTNIVIAFLMGIVGLPIAASQFLLNNTLGIANGVIFLIMSIYSFKGAFSLFKNRNNIPASKVVLKNVLIMPFRPRSILLISSLILIFVGYLAASDEYYFAIGGLGGLILLVIGAFLFTRVKYFCKLCGKKMSKVESTFRGRDFENFKINSTDSKIWIEGDISDNYDCLYWCSHCKSYERVISKKITKRVRIDE